MIDLVKQQSCCHQKEHVIDNRPGWIPVDGTNYRIKRRNDI